MLKTLITLLEISLAVLALAVAVFLVTQQKVVAKATAFCEREVVVGKSSAELSEKAKKMAAKLYFSSPEALMIVFTGSARPVLCYVTLSNGIVMAKHLDTPD